MLPGSACRTMRAEAQSRLAWLTKFDKIARYLGAWERARSAHDPIALEPQALADAGLPRNDQAGCAGAGPTRSKHALDNG